MTRSPDNSSFLMKKLKILISYFNTPGLAGITLFLLLFSITAKAQVQYSSYEKIDSFYKNTTPQFTVDYVSRLEDTFGIEGRVEAMKRLNALFSDVYDSFTLHPERSKEEALNFFNVIDSLFEKHDMWNTSGKFMNKKLSNPYKGVACFHRSLIYNTLGEIYPFEIRPVLASDNHIFVRYEIPSRDTFINWETTSGKTHPDLHYIKKYNLSEQSIKNGCYMRTLTDQEALATIFRYMASKVRESTGDISQYMPFAKQVYKHDTLRLRTLHALSLSYSKHQFFDSALVYINKALRLDTANTASWYCYGTIMNEKGEKERALDYFEKALKLDPFHARAMYEIGLIALENGDMEKVSEMLERLKKRDMTNLPYIFNLDRKLEDHKQNNKKIN